MNGAGMETSSQNIYPKQISRISEDSTVLISAAFRFLSCQCIVNVVGLPVNSPSMAALEGRGGRRWPQTTRILTICRIRVLQPWLICSLYSLFWAPSLHTQCLSPESTAFEIPLIPLLRGDSVSTTPSSCCSLQQIVCKHVMIYKKFRGPKKNSH